MSQHSQQPDQDQQANGNPEATPGTQASTGGTIPGPDQNQNAEGNPEAASTQENMGDGAGIRGSYGDASQTNGLEGGPQAEPDDLTRRGVGD
ncbi:hypothetical protein [Hymenobacter guriensis]|uniref:Uncharacterized protein n=1 Tax=Hymenobacter guriensis TaxID=2793065 RepID=A0ABS0L5E8_9BACT|nr:hypothetical protein [Hymenobacter guriensis]MBG8555306.1 hypothetical protein [Hymenobacter guriensis]